MPSKIQICTMALLSLGTRGISAPDERTPEATYCNQFYDISLEEVLRDHPWNFAQARVALAELPVPAEWAREYPAAYAYPDSCLRLNAVIDETGHASREFTVARHAGRTIVLTRVPRPIASFTTLVDDPACFDPMFAQALAARLAVHLAAPILKGEAGVIKMAEQNYALALSRAKTADAREGRTFSEPDRAWDGGHDNPWIAARMGCYAHGGR